FTIASLNLETIPLTFNLILSQTIITKNLILSVISVTRCHNLVKNPITPVTKELTIEITLVLTSVYPFTKISLTFVIKVDILVFSSSYLPLIQATVLFNQLVIVSQSPVKKPTKPCTTLVKNPLNDSMNKLYFSTIVVHTVAKKPVILSYIPKKKLVKDSINELYFSTKYSHIPTKNSTTLLYSSVKNVPTDSINEWYFSTIYSHMPVKNSTILLYIVV